MDMGKKILAIYDRGIDKDLMKGFSVLEKYGYKLELVEKTVGENELEYQNSMLSVEVNGPDRTPINEEAMLAAKDARIIITHFAPISRKMIESAEKLEIIATLRTGMENINLEAAAEKGVKVINAPCRASDAVADFTVAAMICEARNIARTDADIKSGGWQKKFPNMTYSKNMSNYKVGLIGFGDIGKKTAKRLHGFNTTILVYDPYCSNDQIEALGCIPVTLDELIRESDFISLHMRLTPETKNMINAEMFSKMKPTAFFINTARAGLVDEEALVEALQEKRIGGAVLDVFREEPLPEDHPLRSLDNVTLSAHLAGTSVGTFNASIEIVSNNLANYMQGKPLINVVG
jgi:D-3-phosphoglycerate dehydrogenase